MKPIRTVFGVLALAFMLQSPPSLAVIPTSDQSDLWWTAGEDGWGMQMVERDNRIFATIYVYDSSGNPVWYTSLMDFQGNLSWKGDLYTATGTWFGAVPYVASSFKPVKVGTMTWTATDLVSGTLAYSVNGVPVSKSIVRFTIGTEDFSGTYLGGLHLVQTGCTDPTANGTREGFTNFINTQNGSSFQLALIPEAGPACTLAGTLTQAGRFGSVSGQYTCVNGTMGTFGLDGAAVGVNTFSTHFTAVDTVTGCTATGYLGGIRHR